MLKQPFKEHANLIFLNNELPVSNILKMISW